MTFLALLAALAAIIVVMFTGRYLRGLLICTAVTMPVWIGLNAVATHPLSPWHEMDFVYLSVLVIAAVYSGCYAVAAILRKPTGLK
jgi:hypothetical protein